MKRSQLFHLYFLIEINRNLLELRLIFELLNYKWKEMFVLIAASLSCGS